MKIQEMIDKSIKPVIDNMNGYYTIRVKNNKPYYNKARNSYSKERTILLYLCHCESCGKEDFRYKITEFPKHILCRKKKCKQIFTLKNIKPIKHPYKNKLLTIEECPKGYFRNSNPLKAWLGTIKSNEEIRLAHQTDDWKQSQRDKHPVWSYAYYVKNNPNLVIDFSKSWEQRQKEFYKSNPYNNKEYRNFVNKNRDKWINNNLEHYRKKVRLNKAMYRKENPGIFIVKNLIRDVFRRANQKKTKATNKMGFDIQGIIDNLRLSAKELGYKGLKDIKNTKKYHIDHIIPCAMFNLKKHSERLRCNNPLNLQWLPVAENLEKSDHIRPQDLKIIKTLPRNIYPEAWKGKAPKACL